MKLFSKSREASQKQPDTIRVVSFNVHFGEEPAQLASAFLENENLALADVILLQEIEHYPHEGKSRAEYIAHELGMRCIYAPARETKNDGTHGLALLTRLPCTKHVILDIPKFDLIVRSRKRVALYCRLIHQGSPVHIYNIHLDTRINADERIRQLAALLPHMNKRKDGPIILAGDLNTVPVYWLRRVLPIFYARQKQKLHEFLESHRFSTKGEKSATMRQGLVRFALDGIYVRDCKMSNYGVETSVRLSDHLPLWVDVEM